MNSELESHFAITPQRQRELQLLKEQNANLQLLDSIKVTLRSLPLSEMEIIPRRESSIRVQPRIPAEKRHITLGDKEFVVNATAQLQNTSVPSLIIRITLDSPTPTDYSDHELSRSFKRSDEAVVAELSFNKYAHHQEVDIQSRIDVRDNLKGKGLGSTLSPLTHEIIREVISIYPDFFVKQKVISTVVDLSQGRWTSRRIEKMGYKRSFKNILCLLLTGGVDSDGNQTGPTYTYVYQDKK